MSKTYRLNDLQLVLLSAAAAREDGSLIPLPEGHAHDNECVRKAIASLLRRSLISEASISDKKLAWRKDGEEHVGLFITDAGRSAIGTDAADEDGSAESNVTEAANDDQPASPEDTKATTSHPRPGSKIASVIALLEREEGATLDELVAATDWQAHTTRAALTGLRKKGHAITKSKRDNLTCYHIAAGA